MRRISFKIHPRNQQGCFASVRRLVRRNSSWKSAYVATRTTPPPKLDEGAQARSRQRQTGLCPPSTERVAAASRRSDLYQSQRIAPKDLSEEHKLGVVQIAFKLP